MNMMIALLVLAAAAPATAQTQARMNAEAAADYRRADAALNAQYRVTMAEARDDGPGAASALLAAQRAWLAFRDAECARQGHDSRGGSIHAMVESGCKAALTEQRTQQLKSEPR